MKLTLATVAALAGIASASPYITSGEHQSLDIELDTAGVAVSTLTINLSGMESWDLFGDPDNTLLSFGLFGSAQIIAIDWSLMITAHGASWLSEVNINLSNTDKSGSFNLTPGSGNDAPGTGSFSSGGFVDLVGPGDDFALNADGQLHVELYESFDDVDDAVDATFGTASFIRVQYVPAPGALAVLGLGGFISTRRKR